MNAELQNTTVIDGFIIDIETGEVLGHEKQDFRVTDEKSADWVLEKIMDVQCERARIAIKRKALLENLDSQDKDLQRREDWLQTRFGPDLESFAREQLKDAKTKTWKGTFGRLSFRTAGGGLKVADQDKALSWAKGFAPHTIKVVESFLISQLSADEKDSLKVMYQCAEPYPHPKGGEFVDKGYGAFKLEEPTETFKIETGVGS